MSCFEPSDDRAEEVVDGLPVAEPEDFRFEARVKRSTTEWPVGRTSIGNVQR